MRSSSAGPTFLLTLLALLVMASGIGLLYYSAVFRRGQLHAFATATVQTIQTVQTQTRAKAYAKATGTTQAYDNATAVAQGVATAQAMATTTALQNIYNQATTGIPLLNEPL